MILHALRGRYTDDAEGNLNDLTHGGTEKQTGFQNSGLRVLDAADGVEFVEAGSQFRDEFVDAAGVIVPGSETDLLWESGELLDELLFLRCTQQSGVGGSCVFYAVTLGRQSGNQGADSRMGVLYIVDRVLRGRIPPGIPDGC